MAVNVIRELLVRLGVQVNPKSKAELRAYNDALERVKGTMEDVGRAAARTTTALVGAAVAGATAAIELARAVGQQATDIERQALLLNLTRREYQQWMHVAQTFGVNGREVADAFLQINAAAQKAIGGGKEATENFALLGVRVQQLKGLNPGQLFELLADAASKATDRGKAMAAVSRLLGEEAARKLGPAMMQGAAAVRALRMEAEELGLVMNDQQLATAKAASDAWKRLKFAATGLRNEIGTALAPAVTELLEGMTRWVRANRELLSQRLTDAVFYLTIAVRKLNAAVQLIGGWDVILANVATGAGMLLLIANLGRVQAALSAIRVVAAGVQVALGLIGLEVSVALSPVLLLFAGFIFYLGLMALAVDDFLTFWRGGQSVLGANLDLLERFIPGFGALRELFGALIDLVVTVIDNFGRFKDAILTGLSPAFELLEVLLRPVAALLDYIWQRIDNIVSAPLDRLTGLLRAGSGVIDAVGASSAVAVQGNMAGAIEGQVSRVSTAVDNSTRNWSVMQTNHLYGPASTDTTASLERAIRSATRETGGRR